LCDDLNERIWAAFADVQAPDPSTIVEGALDRDEDRDITDFYRNRGKEEVTYDAVRACTSGLGGGLVAMLSAPAFVYYMPAYMVICLDHLIARTLGILCDSFIWDLAGANPREFRRSYDLSPAQKAVVREFFLALRDRYGDDNFDFDLVKAADKYL